MPRCFLAKKSASTNGLHWGPEDVTNNNNSENAGSLNRPSTIGSISAAKAVLSIQEPICPPPAHQASILASSASAVKAAMVNLKEPNNNHNRGTQTPPWISSNQNNSPAAKVISTHVNSRPPRRKRPTQRLPLNLTMGDVAKATEDYLGGK